MYLVHVLHEFYSKIIIPPNEWKTLSHQIGRKFLTRTRLCLKPKKNARNPIILCIEDTYLPVFSPYTLYKPPTNTTLHQPKQSNKRIQDRWFWATMRSNYLLSLLTLLLALLVVCHGVVPATARRQLEEEEGEWDKELFLLQRSKQIVRTEAGEMRVVRSVGGGRIVDRPMHIGFITMEPQTLYVPQYIDSSLILFVRRGTIYDFSEN